MRSILEYDTVALNEEEKALVIVDQTLLPGEIRLLHLTAQNEIWEAIKVLRVRGAPAIGVAAGIALYLASMEITAAERTAFLEALHRAAEYLNSARPTAVNLSWALARMERAAQQGGGTPEEIRETLHRECLAIWAEDIDVCRRLGENGLTLVKPGDGLLTHCNAGQLATVRYGTASAPIYLAMPGATVSMFTAMRPGPLLQGARLTSFELSSAGIDTTLICDNMGGRSHEKGTGAGGVCRLRPRGRQRRHGQ